MVCRVCLPVSPVANLNLLYPLLPSLTLPYPLLSRRGPSPPPCSVLPLPLPPQASRRKDPQLIWHRRARDADNSGLRTVAQGTCPVQRRVLIVHMACVALALQGALVPFTYSLARRSLTAYIPTLPLMRKTMQTRCRPRLPTHQRRPAPRCIHAIHVQIGFAQPPGPACAPAEPAHNHPLRNQYIYRRLMLPWVDFFSPPLSDFPHPFSSHRRRCPFCFFCVLFGRPTTPSANSCRGLPRPTSMTDLRHFLRCSLLRSFVHLIDCHFLLQPCSTIRTRPGVCLCPKNRALRPNISTFSIPCPW